MTIKRRTNAGKVPVGIYLDEEEYEELRRLGFAENMTANAFAVYLIQRFIKASKSLNK